MPIEKSWQANQWERTYNLTPGRELLFACRYRLGTASNFVVHMSEADNVYDPLYGSGSFVGDQGAWSTAKMYLNGAALWGALPGAGPAQPDGWNGGRLRPPDPGRNFGDRQHCGGGGETLLLRLQLGDVRQRGRQRLRGRHRNLPRHGLAGRLEHGAPGLLAAVGGHAGPVQHADQGLSLQGGVGLRDGPAGGPSQARPR